ncbi:MAG: XTP/dITP diphosphatase [Candidatus Methanomethyliaceae archaeon]|nr:XTP/dITP diphosphatase [Candidatus Methanomethyliaceae archaeon]
MVSILFITSNEHKVEEANRILSQFGIQLEMFPQKKIEIQSKSLLKIAKYAAHMAAKRLKSPVLVEDSGLFIRALKGFPGPFSSYIHETIGCEGVLKLLSGIEDRYAVFKCAVAFCSPSLGLNTFQGRSIGRISLNMRGQAGFGFDPIFVPHGEELTFAEMLPEQKDRFSHRGAALRAFGSWLSSKSMAKP